MQYDLGSAEAFGYTQDICDFSFCFILYRAYVEFFRNIVRTAGVLPEVDLALRMAHFRLPLELFVHPLEEIEAKAGESTVSALRYARYS